MNATPETPTKGKVLRPSFTPNALLYTISRHKLGMTQKDASTFVDACLRFANDRPDPAPEAA